jgi:hypothetical protein
VSAGPLGAGLRWAVAEARALVLLERFFALLEQAAEPPVAPDSLTQLAPVVRGWRRALRSGVDAAALDAGARAWSVLEACRQRVVERDRAIPAYRIRWACEHAPLSDRSLATLARFYRTLPYSSASQSKYEHVVTRLLAGPLKRRRDLVAAPHEVLERLVAIEKSCGADPVGVPEALLRSGIAELARFVREAREQPDLASLTSSSLFQRAGAFKARLGAALFEPRVALAVVECNLRLGNVLCELLAREAEDAAAPAAAPVETEPVATVPAVEAPPPVEPEVEIEVEIPSQLEATTPAPAPPAVREELPPAPSPRAAELGKLPENAAVVASYLRPPRSPEVYELDLDRFLSPLPGATQPTTTETADRRRALELILAADDLVWARDEGAAGEEHRERVRQTTREMLAHGNALNATLAKAQQDAPEVVESLFYVSDHLLWARLRLTASLNRPPRKRISLARAPKAAAPPLRATTGRAWRLAAMAALVALALSFLPGAFARPMPVAAEVRVLDPKSVPGGAYVSDVRQHKSVLYVAVLPAWSGLGEGQRRESLRALAEFGSVYGINTVSVSGPQGQPLGCFADGESTLVSDLPQEGS